MSKQLKPMLTPEIVELFNEEELIVIAGGKGVRLPFGIGDLFYDFNGLFCKTINSVPGCGCVGTSVGGGGGYSGGGYGGGGR